MVAMVRKPFDFNFNFGGSDFLQEITKFYSLPSEYTLRTGSIEIEMPGVKKEDVSVELLGEKLKVSWKDRTGSGRVLEFTNADGSDEPKASLKDGILRIEIDGKPTPKTKKIRVD